VDVLLVLVVVVVAIIRGGSRFGRLLMYTIGTSYPSSINDNHLVAAAVVLVVVQQQ